MNQWSSQQTSNYDWDNVLFGSIFQELSLMSISAFSIGENVESNNKVVGYSIKKLHS